MRFDALALFSFFVSRVKDSIRRIAGRFVSRRNLAPDMPMIEEDMPPIPPAVAIRGYNLSFSRVRLVLFPTEDLNRQHLVKLRSGFDKSTTDVRAYTLPVFLLECLEGHLSLEFRGDRGISWHWYESLPAVLTASDDGPFGNATTTTDVTFHSRDLLDFLNSVCFKEYEPSTWSGWDFGEALIQRCAPVELMSVFDIPDETRVQVRQWAREVKEARKRNFNNAP